MDIILYVLTFIIILLLGLLIYFICKFYKCNNEYIADKDIFLYNKSKISMIEYQYRNFKEGQNPFTTLRNMSEILKDIYPKDNH